MIRAVMVVLALISTSGCSLFYGHKPFSHDVKAEFAEQANSAFAYGEGTASTEQEAWHAARRELAEQVSIHIYSEVKSAQRVINRENSHQIVREEDFSNFVSSYSQVQLDGVSKDASVATREGWYVRAKISREQLHDARQRMTRQAPALAYVHLMSSGDEHLPGLQMRYALHGLQAAHQQGILHETFNAAGTDKNITFRAFFTQAIEQSRDQLLLLPIRQGDTVKFALLHKTTYTPQSGFVIRVDQRYLQTDESGHTAALKLADLNNEFTPLLSGYRLEADEPAPDQHLLELMTFEKSRIEEPHRSRIYVASIPAGSLITLKQDARIIDEGPAPIVFDVAPNLNNLSIHAKAAAENYRIAIEPIANQKSPNYFVNMRLIEKRMGMVDLNVAGSYNVITLKSGKGDIIEQQKNRIRLPVEAGHYSITVFDREDKDYQIVQDEFSVQQNETVSRVYKHPIYRAPYINGHMFDLNFGFGGDLDDNFKIQSKNADSNYGDFSTTHNLNGNSSMHLQLRSMELFNTGSLATNISLDYRNYRFETASSQQELTLNGLGISAGLGFWTSKLLGEVAWLTANYNYSFYSWDSNILHTDVQQLKDFSLGYPFIEMGIRFEVFGLGVRLSDPELAAPVLFLSIGSTTLNRGYRYDDKVKARQGEHY